MYKLLCINIPPKAYWVISICSYAFFVCVAAVIKAETLTAFTLMLQWTQVQKLTQVLISVFVFVSNGRCVNHTAAWIAARIDKESISHIRIKVQQRSSPAFMSCTPCDKYVSKCHCTNHFLDVSVFRRLFELTESLYDLLAPCLGTKHQYPSLGMQLLINNSNVINNSCEATHLCLCQPSITLDCAIKKEWIKVIHIKKIKNDQDVFAFISNNVVTSNMYNSLHLNTGLTLFVADRLCGTTTLETKHQTCNTMQMS